MKSIKDKESLTYMDCWYFVAPLLPVPQDPITTEVYIKVFSALKDAEDREIRKDSKNNEK